MAWSPTLPAEPPTVLAPWTELSINRVVAGVVAEMRANEREKRRRQNHRRVEKIDEALCLAAAASEYRRKLPYERRSAGPEEVEFAVRQVSPAELWNWGDFD